MSVNYKRLSSYIDGDKPERYRELVVNHVPAGKDHKLSLVLNDHELDPVEYEDREYIVIPLGTTDSVAKDSARPEAPAAFRNFTVPLIIKRYADPDFAKDKAKELRKGWLYIYCDGHLWRELQINQHGFCRDVNLRRHQGQDLRRATGEADCRVIVPWKINNEKRIIEIAYSEVQWSWARIEALGGISRDREYEVRLRPDTLPNTVDKAKAAERRRNRMQDISRELDAWILSNGQDKENIQHIDNVGADIYSLQLHKNSALPVVFLKDYHSIVRELAGEAHQASKKIKEMQDRDGHRRTVADIVENILKSYPDYSKHLRSSEDRIIFCKNYDAELSSYINQYNSAQDALINFLQNNRPVFQAIWDDYEPDRRKVPDHQENLEEIWFTILAAISPMVKKQASGEETPADEPDRLTKVLGTVAAPTPEGQVFLLSALLVEDRLTGHTDNLVGMLGNYLSKQENVQEKVLEPIARRYRLSGYRNIKVTFEEITIPAANYLGKLPEQARWGEAIEALSGKPVRAAEAALTLRRLRINVEEVIRAEEIIETVPGDLFNLEALKKRLLVRLRKADAVYKIRKGLRGLQALNVCVALRDLLQLRDTDTATRAAYVANLISDALGLAAMYEKGFANSKVLTRFLGAEVSKHFAAMVAGLMNTVSGLCLSIFEAKMAIDEYQSDDEDAAVAHSGMSLGGILFGLGTLGVASEAAANIVAAESAGSLVGASASLARFGLVVRLAALSRFAPLFAIWGWVGVALIVGNVIYLMYADNNPLEEWQLHCAWGHMAYDGEGTVANRKGEQETIHYAGWQVNPGAEIAAILRLLVGYSAEATWLDNRDKVAISAPSWEKIRKAPQGFNLNATVPPFSKGKLIMGLIFYDTTQRGKRFFNEERSAESYYQNLTKDSKDYAPDSRPQAITHNWGIGVEDIPKDAVVAEVRLWFDPYGDGTTLLPNSNGLLLTTYKEGETAHAQSL